MANYNAFSPSTVKHTNKQVCIHLDAFINLNKSKKEKKVFLGHSSLRIFASPQPIKTTTTQKGKEIEKLP